MKKLLPFATLALLFFCTGRITAQNNDAQLYQKPPKAIADLIKAPGSPSISLSPGYDRYIISEMSGLPSIREVSQEELSLAGTRILPATNGPKLNSKILSLSVYAVDASPAALAKSKIVQGKIDGLPDFPILQFSYDPTGSRIAIMVETNDAIECWVAELSDLKAHKVSSRTLNAFFLSGPIWTPDGNSLILATVPERKVVPAPDLTPKGPVVQISDGKATPVRTYQDLLKDSYTEALFDYYANAEMVKIDLRNKSEQVIAPKAIYTSFVLSPDGNYFLASTLHRPYSYSVPASLFPSKLAVWSIDGKLISVLNETELRQSTPLTRGSVLPGKRSFGWRADQPATIYWVEALDGGDIRKKVDKRDEVWLLEAPFTGSARSFLKTDLRYGGITWGDNHHAVLFTSDAEKKMRYSYLFDPAKPEVLKPLFSVFSEDRYSDPGNIVLNPRSGSRGQATIYTADNFKTIYLAGEGYSAEGCPSFYRPIHDCYGQDKAFVAMRPYAL